MCSKLCPIILFKQSHIKDFKDHPKYTIYIFVFCFLEWSTAVSPIVPHHIPLTSPHPKPSLNVTNRPTTTHSRT
jgi:hypothetical protein